MGLLGKKGGRPSRASPAQGKLLSCGRWRIAYPECAERGRGGKSRLHRARGRSVSSDWKPRLAGRTAGVLGRKTKRTDLELTRFESNRNDPPAKLLMVTF